MEAASEFVVSTNGQMSVPAAVRHRWGLDGGGRITVVDLGEAVLLLAPGTAQKLLDSVLSTEEHLSFVQALDDPDLATS